MFPWSVIPTAGWPSAATVATTSPIRDAPSSIEYSVCRCRWTNDGFTVPFATRPGSPQAPGVPVENYKRVTPNLRPGPGHRKGTQARPRPARRGTSISAAVSDPWAEIEPASRSRSGSMNATGSRGASTTSPTRRRVAGDGAGPSQASSRSCSRPNTQARSAKHPVGRLEQRGAGARLGVEVAEPPVARAALDEVAEGLETEPAVGADVDLAVVGGDDQRGALGERVAQVADQPVGDARARRRRSRRGGRGRGRPRRPRRSRRTRTARPPRRAGGSARRATTRPASRGTGCRAGAPR